jgi:hypothetical protein
MDKHAGDARAAGNEDSGRGIPSEFRTLARWRGRIGLRSWSEAGRVHDDLGARRPVRPSSKRPLGGLGIKPPIR